MKPINFRCLLICMDRNKENLFHQSFLSVTELCQQHNIIGKNESVLSPGNLVFLDVKLAQNCRN